MTTIDASAFRAELAKLRGALVTAAERTVADAVDAAERSAKATRLFNDGPNATLRSSIHGEASGFSGTVAAGADHAVFVNDGTRAHIIEGKPTLRFVVNGSVVFARRVNHPGTAARPFMDEAAKVGDKAMDASAERTTSAAIAVFNRAG